MEACEGCDFVLQMWHYVVGLYDYTLLLEYCPFGTMQSLLNVSEPFPGDAIVVETQRQTLGLFTSQ